MPTNAYISKRTMMATIMETTYNDGTVATTAPGALTANGKAVLVEDLEITPDTESLPRVYLSDQLGSFRPELGKIMATLSGSVEMKGKGAAYADTVAGRPEIDHLLRCCALSSTFSGGAGTETITYAPASATRESIAIDVHMDGKRLRLTGCVGTGRFVLEAHKIPKFEFEIRGLLTAFVDATFGTFGSSYSSIVPPVVRSIGWTVGARALYASKVEVDLGNEIMDADSVNSADGVRAAVVVLRNVVGSMDPEFEADTYTLTDTAAATHTLQGGGLDRPHPAFALTATVSVAQYNRFTLAAARLVFTGMKPTDSNGIRRFQIPFVLAADPATANGDLTLTFN